VSEEEARPEPLEPGSIPVVGVSLEGVHFGAQLPSGEIRPLALIEPEVARRIAMTLTLRSFECEDMRVSHGEGKSGGQGQTGGS
jgi:hypothetical protein